MATYRNDYTKKEDELLWEIHNIRHDLNKQYRKKTISEINLEAHNKIKKWEKENEIGVSF